MKWLDHFGWIAPYYDRFAGIRDSEILERFLDLNPACRLVDIGGGTGRVSGAFAHQVRSAIVVDEAFPMLLQAKAKSGLYAVQACAERLPFADGSIDRILMVDTFHHLVDQTLAISETWRITAPGGRILIEEPDLKLWPVKGIALAEKLLLMRSHFQRPEWIADRFTQLGAVVDLHREGINAWILAVKPE